MKISDFKVGQTVCLRVREGSNKYRSMPKDCDPERYYIEGKVEKIGRKYVVVSGHKFDHTNNFIHSNDGIIDYELFLSKEDAKLDTNRKQEYLKLKANVEKYGKQICYEDLAAINAILEKYTK